MAFKKKYASVPGMAKTDVLSRPGFNRGVSGFTSGCLENCFVINTSKEVGEHCQRELGRRHGSPWSKHFLQPYISPLNVPLYHGTIIIIVILSLIINLKTGYSGNLGILFGWHWFV